MVDVLVALAPHLPNEVLAQGQQLSEEWNRAKAVAAVIPQLSEERRLAITQETLGAHRPDPIVLAALAPYLSREEIRQLYPTLGQSPDVDADVVEAFRQFYKRWQETAPPGNPTNDFDFPFFIQLFAQAKRSTFLDFLAAANQTLATLGGEALLIETLAAVKQTTQWWP